MKKLLILILLFFVSCTDKNNNISVQETNTNQIQETTSTTSVIEKRKEDCRIWKEKTAEDLTKLSDKQSAFYRAIALGDLSTSWFRNQNFSEVPKIVHKSLVSTSENRGVGINKKVKNDVLEAALWYIEGFSKWEKGYLENDLTIFNEGTTAINMAEKLLQPYMVSSDQEPTQYSFPDCSISN